MRTISLKVIESKNPGIKINWIKELDNHGKICRFSNFIIDEDEISCEKCYRTLLKFCSFCGSTRIEESKFHYKCSVCKSITDKKFL
jgi:Zn finger protein HypA/HybF involved in hydrogenase expression